MSALPNDSNPLPLPQPASQASRDSVPPLPAAPPYQPTSRADFDESNLRRFLSYLMDPSIGLMEMRVKGARYESKNEIVIDTDKTSSIMASWYDNPDAFIIDAKKLKNLSAYACLNPVNPSILIQSDEDKAKNRKPPYRNHLARSYRTTKAADVVCWRWFFIDIDSKKKGDSSATQEELGYAIAMRDRILREHPRLAACALYGQSGNGCFILVRLPDYPNDDVHRKLIGRANASLVARYQNEWVGVDDKTKDPSRIGPVPGTMKCKGDPTPERPWRLASLDGAGGVPLGDDPGDDPELVGFDLVGWLAEHPGPVEVVKEWKGQAGATQGGWTQPLVFDHSRVLVRAEAFVAKIPGAISGQDGHNQTFSVATALVKGFGLDVNDAWRILCSYNCRCNPPWTEGELRHKLENAIDRPDTRQPGYLLQEGDRKEANINLTNSSPSSSPILAPNQIPALRIYPNPVVDRDALFRRIKTLQSDHQIEDLYRDRETLANFARFEIEDACEANIYLLTIERIKGFKPDPFRKAMAEFRKAAKTAKKEADQAKQAQTYQANQANRGESSHSFSDMGNAARFVERFGPVVRYCKAYGDWMVYDRARWKLDMNLEVENYAKEIPEVIRDEMPATQDVELIEAYSEWALKTESRERLSAILVTARSKCAVSPSSFNTDPWLLNVQNGTIDLKTGTFRPHHPADLITKLAPVTYDPTATCPRWERFVLEIMAGNEDVANFLRRVMGYSATAVVEQAAFFIAYGKGENGKSLFFKTLSDILGDYAVDLDPEVLLASTSSQHPTGLTELEGRRLIVAEETDEQRGLAEALVKRVTGGTKISARKMGKDFYDFMPTHHLFLATNHKPEIRNQDHGMWRRIKLIPFLMQFDGKDGNPPADLKLGDTLAGERSGILNWLLRGCQEWQQMGLGEPTTIVEATQLYRGEMDLVGQFIEEKCEKKVGGRVIFDVLYGEYRAWCEMIGCKGILGRNKFGRNLNDRGHVAFKSNGVTYKMGLELNVNKGYGVMNGFGEYGQDRKDRSEDCPY